MSPYDSDRSVLNGAAADALMDYLARNHGRYVALEGRVGAYPCIRWMPGDEAWELSSEFPTGERITQTLDDAEVREALMGGPFVSVYEMDRIGSPFGDEVSA